MLLGIPIGTVAALVLARVLASTLYGVAPTDPRAIIVTAAVLTATAMLACLIPARRAIRVDLVDTLRGD
jgi:ABC-type antimicrobial peptide transport system permease subunit